MSRSTLNGLVFLCLFSMTLTACETGDPSTPEYWIPQLEKVTRGAAIKKLREMKSKEAVEPLMALYDTGKRRQMLSPLWRRSAISGRPNARQGDWNNTEPKTAQLAAATLKTWGQALGTVTCRGSFQPENA